MDRPVWIEGVPIWRQLRERIATMILEGALTEGARLPSVREAARQWHLNAITVLRAYQQLALEQRIEKLRGRGMIVSAGARARLLADERAHFLAQEWPALQWRMQRLGLTANDLPGSSGLSQDTLI